MTTQSFPADDLPQGQEPFLTTRGLDLRASASVGVIVRGDGLPGRLLVWVKLLGLDLICRVLGLSDVFAPSPRLLLLLLPPDDEAAKSVAGEEFFLLMVAWESDRWGVLSARKVLGF